MSTQSLKEEFEKLKAMQAEKLSATVLLMEAEIEPMPEKLPAVEHISPTAYQGGAHFARYFYKKASRILNDKLFDGHSGT